MRNRSALVLGSFALLLNACAASPDAADDDEEVGESAAALTTGPDLQVTALTAPASADGPLNMSATVCNKGNAEAGPSTLRFSFTDERNPSYTFPINDSGLMPLAAGACVTIPATGYGPGRSAFVLSATADATNVVTERNETNNTRVGKRIAFGPLADLQVVSVSGPPSLSDWGPQGWTASARICNRGSAPSYPTMVDFYLSTDTAITSSDALLGPSEWIPGLNIDGCIDVAHRVDWMSSISPPSPSIVRLGAIVDGQSREVELVETNNTRASGPIGYGHLPDFIVTNFTTPVSSDFDQHFFATTVTVCNQGTTTDYAPEVVVVHSGDTTIDLNDPHDNIVGRTYPHGSLNPGQCTTLAVNVDGFIPNLDAPPMTNAENHHYFGVVLDVNNGIPELQETNNTSAAKEVALGHGPDLVVSALAAPASAPRGPFDTTVKVCNQGTRPSDPSNLDLVQSTDAVFDESADLYVGRADVPALTAGQCKSIVVPTLGFYGPPSNVYLVARARTWGPELITTNNTRARAITVAAF